MDSSSSSSTWLRVCWIGLNGISKCKLVKRSVSGAVVSISSLDASFPFTQDVSVWSDPEGDRLVSLIPDAASLVSLDQHVSRCFAFARPFSSSSSSSDQDGDATPWLMDARTWLAHVAEERLARKFASVKIGFVVSFYLLRGSDAQGWHPVDSR